LRRILFLVPYPFGCAPSQRYRFEQYLNILDQKGFSWEFAPFLDKETWAIIYKRGHYLQKIRGTFSGLFRRLLLLLKISEYTWVFMHREAIPFGPPLYEWILGRLFNKRIIYDFDDAIWIPQKSPSNVNIDLLKNYNKIAKICGISKRVCVGNSYLSDYVRKYNPEVHIIPTSINTQTHHCRIKNHVEDREVTIGWTGSHSTISFLDLVSPAIKKLESRYPLKFLVIADERPKLDLNSLVYKDWSKETEVDDLFKIDIGLMPLPDTEWSKGKCGLKALQYMALGIPAVVSPIGVNAKIVQHKVDGFHCRTEEDWYYYIEKLILGPQLRNQMGRLARVKVNNNYSIQANAAKFLSLLSD